MNIKKVLEQVVLIANIQLVLRLEERNATTVRFVNKFVKINNQYFYYYRDCLKKTVKIPLKSIDKITFITDPKAKKRNVAKIIVVEMRIKVTKENQHFIW